MTKEGELEDVNWNQFVALRDNIVKCSLVWRDLIQLYSERIVNLHGLISEGYKSKRSRGRRSGPYTWAIRIEIYS